MLVLVTGETGLAVSRVGHNVGLGHGTAHALAVVNVAVWSASPGCLFTVSC